jgi:uncharacterized membrane protein (DUF485 family)
LDPRHRALLDSAEFRHLVRRRWRVSMLLTGLLFILYYGFILLIAVDRPFLAQRIGRGVTTVGIPLGMAVIVGSWVLTFVYIAWANRRYDPEVARLRERARNG